MPADGNMVKRTWDIKRSILSMEQVSLVGSTSGEEGGGGVLADRR